MFRRAIISRSDLERERLSSERARAEHPRRCITLVLPRLGDNWRAALGTLKHKDRIIMRYMLMLVLLLHYEACGIRFVHGVQTKRGDKEASTVVNQRGHYGTPLLDRDSGSPSYWVEYVICVDWALSTLLAESSYVTAMECGLSVCNMLFGLLFMSYLIADLTNTLCHLDPAANDFKMTSDSLRDFLETHDVPGQAIDSVREYLEASEDLFRVKFNYQLLQRLSPQLQDAVSQWLLGQQCARLPFLLYCKQQELDVRAGRRAFVGRPPRAEQPRRFTVQGMADGLQRMSARLSGSEHGLHDDGGGGAAWGGDADAARPCKIPRVDRCVEINHRFSLGRPHQTLKFSSSVKSKSIRLIFGRIDCSRQVLEARPKSSRRNGRIRSN